MNSKIPFHQLSALLAEKCAISAAEAEDFVRGFFDLVTESLIEGNEVRIKGIGTFQRTDDPEQPVKFIPDSALADGINSPFAMFEPEELGPEVTESLLAAEDEAAEEPVTEALIEEVVETPAEVVVETPAEVVAETPTEEVAETPAEVVVETPAEVVAETPTEVVVEAPVEEVVETPVEEDVEAPVKVVEKVPTTPAFEDDDEEEYLPQPDQSTSQSSWGWGFVIGLLVGMAVGACAVYFAIDYIFPNSKVSTELAFEPDQESIDETEALLSELQAEIPAIDSASASTEAANVSDTASVPAANAEPAAATTAAETKETSPATTEATPAAPVKDTIKAGYLLPTMARKHYGDKSFWVYIYEENKGIISNPNRIRPGLTVVIPPASKYGIDAKNSESIRRAKDKAAEILKKFPN